MRGRRGITVLAVLAVLPFTGCAYVARVSTSATGAEATGASLSDSSVSVDGRYVAFSSDAPNLVPGDTNGQRDVFLKDTVTGEIERVSQRRDTSVFPPLVIQGNGASSQPSISADGRYVAFRSAAANLVVGDTNGFNDVFRFDRVTKALLRVSLTSSGAQANGPSDQPSISADGTLVAFRSRARNFVSGTTSTHYDVFVKTVGSGGTGAVVWMSPRVQWNHPPPPFPPTISPHPANGNSGTPSRPYLTQAGVGVAYQTFATDLVDGTPLSGFGEIVRTVWISGFLGAPDTWDHMRVSRSSSGGAPNDSSTSPSITPDGRWVTFDSWASNLVTGDTNGVQDVFVFDTSAGSTTRARSTTGQQLDGTTGRPAVSDDGRWISFQSAATNVLGAGIDTNGQTDVFVWDRASGLVRRVNVSLGGAQTTGAITTAGAMSGDGSTVTFSTRATELVDDVTNGVIDVYVAAARRPAVTGVTPSTLPADGQLHEVRIQGGPFAEPLSVSIPDAEAEELVSIAPTEIVVTVRPGAGVAPGARHVWVAVLGTGGGEAAGALGLCASCVTIG